MPPTETVTDSLAEKVRAFLRQFLESLYFPAEGRPSLVFFQRFWIAGLLVLGLVQWGGFIDWGKIAFDRGDWAEVTGPRLAFMRSAFASGQLPLHIPVSLTVKNATDRFLSIPDQILSPQVLLLRWLTPGEFVLLQLELMVLLGFVGLLLLRKRFKLGLVPFSALYFLFMFNGHITDHISVGHATWTGYFLLPFFVLLVYDLIDPQRPAVGWTWAAKVSLLLLAMFLQGSFHLFVWCLLFLEFFAIFNRKWFGWVNRAAAAALLLAAGRILPVALASGKLGVDFFGGFLTVQSFFDGFLSLVPVNQSLIPMSSDTNLITWWEYDFYIGLVGLAFVLAFGLYPWQNLSDEGQPDFSKLTWPMALMAFLSIGRIYNVVFLLNIPLLNAERMTTRFLIVPLVFLIVQAVARAQRFLEEKTRSTNVLLGGTFLLLLLINDLQSHYAMWKLDLLGSLFTSKTIDPASTQVINHPDPQYTAALIAGGAISAAAFIALLVLARREKKPVTLPPGSASA